MSDAMILVRALRDPASIAGLNSADWTTLLTIARAEQLIGTLAMRLQGQDVPASVAAILDDARINAEYQRRTALWEADCARRALADYDGKIVLMKGTAYVAAGLQAGEGRHIGDLDIMVAQSDLPQVEAMLLREGGWEWVKDDAYDDAYYRDHMHELPPLIHRTRDRMIDVHHTILPLTARPRPDAAGMLGDAISLPPASGKEALYVFTPTDMVIHCAAHMIADGDLQGGLRNLWDMHCLLSEFAAHDNGFWPALQSRAQHHQLRGAVHMAARLGHKLYGTDIPQSWNIRGNADAFFVRCITARDGYGRRTRDFTRLAFYIRSHWLRMPPMMLAQHLWTKWRKT